MNRLERILQAIKGKGEELKDVGVNVGEHLELDLWNFRGGTPRRVEIDCGIVLFLRIA